MWKRLQGHVQGGQYRDKDRQNIGSPMLVGTTYDEDQLRHIPNVVQAQWASHQHQPHPSTAPPPYNNMNRGPYDEQERRMSQVPTVASVYSRPAPEQQKFKHKSPTGERFDISPPSSPEPDRYQPEDSIQPRRFRSMRDVSPVDENRGRPQQPGSSIPVMRKAPPGLRNMESAPTQKFWGGKVAPNGQVRWDEYSGEPTSSNVGKASQVSPGSYQKGPASPHSPVGSDYGNSTTIQGNSRSNSRRNQSLADRAKYSRPKPTPVDRKPQEPWSKSIGRAEIAKPFKDQPSDKPLNFRKADRRAEGFENISNSAVLTDTTPVADNPAARDTHGQPMKPVAPLNVAATSPRDLRSPTSPFSPGGSNPYAYSPTTPTNKQFSPIPTNDENLAKAEPEQSQLTTPTAKVPRKSTETQPGSTASKGSGPNRSRFSWTTYNSSGSFQPSPPPSPPPLPAPAAPQEPASAAQAILNRRHPISAADRIPVRKPMASPTWSTVQSTIASGPPSPRAESTFSTSTNKALPRPPTESEAADHLEILESQIEDLRVRRNNVYRLLNDLNNRAPPNPMVTDFRRMRLVEQRKKDFADELAEIKREEHEVGLKLHRAWRKRERADPNGSESAIWVRRVTR